MLLVGKTVVFNAAPRIDFCRPHIQNKAKCEIVKVNPNTATVRFHGQEQTDIVYLGYLK